MTTKEKYELIDKTKVSAKVLEILEKMEKASSNFTNAEVNSRVDTALDKIIEGLKVSKPEALLSVSDAKKEVKKEKKEAEEKNEGKDFSKKKDTDNKTGLPKKDTVEERKDIIKKESESEKEARERAKKELEKENEKAKDVIESQLEKLNRIILEDPALRGFNTGTSATGGGKSTPLIDAERKAIARGRRVSQKGRKNQYGASEGGRVYWENRENRSDRKSPDYPTGKPYLEKGGNVYASDDLYEVKMVQDGVELDSKLIRARNNGEARMIFEDMYQEKYQDEFGSFDLEIDIAKDRMADGGVVNTRELNKKIKDWYTKTYPTDEEGKEINDKITFKGFYGYLWQGYDVYDVLEVTDSLIRERVFEKLSEILGVDYDVVYKKWLQSVEYSKGGYMEHRGTITDDSLESILKSDFPKSNYQLHHDNISGHKIYGQKDVIKTIQKHLLTEYGIKSEYDKEGFGLPFLRVYSQFVDKYAQGGYMADGGEIKNLIGKQFRPFTATSNNEYDVKIVNIDFDNVTYKHKDGQVKKSKTSDFLDSYIQVKTEDVYMADGGEVDFDERMAKMRNAYDNLEMLVKGKIAMAIGIDNAISIMSYDYVVDPIDLIKGAVRSGLLELDEINGDLVGSAIQEAERIDEDYRDSGQGIGSSDMTYFTKYVLDGAGYKTGFINNRLTRVDADGNELVINKYEMNF